MTEPATVLTDALVAVLALAWGIDLRRRSRESGSSAQRLWGMTFFALAFSAISGAAYHGTGHVLSETFRDTIWTTTLLSMTLVSGFLFAAVVCQSLAGLRRKWLLGLVILKAILVGAWVLLSPHFIIAIVDYGTAMLVTVTLALYCLDGGPCSSARWYLIAVGISALAAGIQILKLAPHPHFNHNDLFHLVQLVANGCFYRGAQAGRDKQTTHPGNMT